MLMQGSAPYNTVVNNIIVGQVEDGLRISPPS